MGNNTLPVRPIVGILALVVVGATLLGIATGSDWTAGPTTLLGMALAVVMLTVPGSCLRVSLFPKGTGLPRDVDLALIPGLSIASLTLGGLLLAFLAVSLDRTTWVAWAVLVSSASLLVASYRGWAWQTPTWLAGAGSAAIEWPVPRRAIGRASVFLLFAAVALVGVSFAMAVRSQAAQPRAGYTQLWLTKDANGRALDLGVDNEEGRPMTFSLYVTANGKRIAQWVGLFMKPATTWSIRIDQPPGTGLTFEAALYLMDQPAQPYRTATLSERTSVPSAGTTPGLVAIPTFVPNAATAAPTASAGSGASPAATPTTPVPGASTVHALATAPASAAPASPSTATTVSPSLALPTPPTPGPTPAPTLLPVLTPIAATPASTPAPTVVAPTPVPLPTAIPTPLPTAAPTIVPTAAPATAMTPAPLPVATSAPASAATAPPAPTTPAPAPAGTSSPTFFTPAPSP